jgi:type II secretion system protein G
MYVQNRRGFTLIELLIVVAIIAILAAIALPNFLEAQARAKVSRTMADMRSLSTAMLAYATDNNEYPIPSGKQYIGFLMQYDTGGNYAGRLLTSPIAYISSIPVDIYNSDIYTGGFRSYRQVAVVASIKKLGVVNAQFNAWFQEMRILTGMFPTTLDWSMESAGPDLTWWDASEFGPRNPNRFIYDPTNGTLSQGQLVLTSEGWVSPRLL